MANLGALLFGQGLNSFQPGIQLSSDASGAPPVPQELAAGLAPQAAPQMMPQVAPQAVSQAASPTQEDGGFLSLIEKVRSDPALSQAALMAGVRLAQGARPGQTALGLLGDTVLMGTTAYQMMKGNERAQGMQDQKFAADQTREAAVTEGIQLGNREKLGTLPANIKAAILRAEALARKGEIEKASQVFDVAEASLRSAYAGTDQGSLDMLAGIRQQILNPVQKNQRESAESASRIGLQGAQAESAQATTDLTRKRIEDPEKYGVSSKAQVGEKQTFAEWQIKQVMNAYGVDEAEAFRMLQQKELTSKSPEERALRMKFITENYPDKPAKGIAAWEKMQEELAAADAKGTKAAPSSASGGQVAKSPYPEGTQLTGPDGKRYVVKNGVPVPQQ